MEIYVHENRRLVEIWLRRDEQDDPLVMASLAPLYAGYKVKKYTVAVFRSGEQELYTGIRDLLLYNKTRLAELDLRREKQQEECAGG